MTIAVEVKDNDLAILSELVERDRSNAEAVVQRLVLAGLNNFRAARNGSPTEDDATDSGYPSPHDHEAVKAFFARDHEESERWFAALTTEERVRHMEEVERSSASKISYTREQVTERIRSRARMK